MFFFFKNKGDLNKSEQQIEIERQRERGALSCLEELKTPPAPTVSISL